jgi:hypothetical protein
MLEKQILITQAGRGSGGAPTERLGEPISGSDRVFWHLLTEGVFSEARPPQVQVPSGRGAAEWSTQLCLHAERLPRPVCS